MLARFFVDRPIFATVLSLVIIIIGGVSLFRLPVAQYPEVAPPTVEVTAFYPGANAKVVAETVATPIEQEVNGVERMRYMESRSTNDGRMVLTVTFELGTNLDTAQVLVQNRVAIAEPKLPEEARRQGVITKKTSPSLLMVVGLISPNNRYDTLYLSNYAILQVKDALARVPGVGEALLFDSREYSMRIWLDPEKLASRDMTASDVTRALREQNIQVAAGGLGQQPVPTGQDFQYTINTLGRLIEEEQFADIIVKTGAGGQMTRLRDVSRVELGARSYDVRSYLNDQPIVSIGIFELPGSNALETAYGIKAEMERLKSRLPDGVDYRIPYDTTAYIEDSINSVYRTLFEAVILVFIVVLLFLQDWRITLLPMIDVPVALIGTFAVMAALGFSLNNLSLFGLVLAIGIVVDDSIVVVENIERWMAKGLAPREATLKAMEEITGPVIAITLVLSAVFIPTAFVAGISGQFYRQFALTIAASTLISAVNALTMTPARAVQFIRAHDATHDDREPLPRLGIALLFGALAYVWLTPHVAAVIGSSLLTQSSGFLATWLVPGLVFITGSVSGWLLGPGVNWLLHKVFAGFDWAFEKLTIGYGYGVALFLRLSVIVLFLYGGLIGLTYLGFTRIPTGFIPEQDKGYIVVAAQLPDGANLERSDAVMKRASEIARAIPGVAHAVSIPGFSLLTGTNLSNAGTMFVILDPSTERAGRPGLHASDILNQMRAGFWDIQDAFVLAFGAPPVEGIGNTGGFKMQIQDRGGSTPAALQAVVDSVLQTGNAQPGLVGLFSTYRASEPQLYVDVDRAKAKAQGIALSELFDTLQVYLGSAYINDFTRFGRNWQVYAQADAPFRLRTEDIGQLKVRNAAGQMVPLGTLTHIESMGGPSVVSHYNMFPSAAINGSLLPGTSSGQAITMMEHVAWQELPSSMGFEWTELTLEEITAGNTAVFVFALGTLFVFLVLAALYESWSLPLAIILIVPMCLFAAMAGVWIVGSDNNIFTQIGLVVLIGLAAKNAILIVEFAKQREEEGQERRAAIIEASRLRLRPILMTSFAFIFGVLPLLISEGAGAEMRFALGITVFSGMLGVTLFGIFFTPVFYWVIRKLTERRVKIPRIVSPLLVIVTILPLSACTMIGPDYRPPPAPLAEQWHTTTTSTEVQPAPVESKAWWATFNDPTLTTLIETAYRQNPSLQAAGARVLEARARRGIAIGQLFPQQQDAFGSYTRTGVSTETANQGGFPGFTSSFDNWRIGLDAVWELDLWGKFRRGIEAADAALLASVASYDDVLVSLIAEVATNYLALRILEERLEVAQANVSVQQQSFAIADAKFQGGAVTELDAAQAAALVRDTQAQVAALETTMQQTRNTLSILLGLPPHDLQGLLEGAKKIPAPPTTIAVGIPADLLRRRPDLRRAERLLAAQSAEIGIAQTDLFPQFTLSGTLSVTAEEFTDMFTSAGLDHFIGPGFRWAILNYGRIQNNVRVRDARFQALIGEYETTVLRAQREVEDAIAGYLGTQRQVALLTNSVTSAARAVELADFQYREGATDYTRVLTTQQFLVNAQDRLVATRGAVALNLVALYRALGGGWELREGNEFVSDATKTRMRERTNWGELLSPEAGAAEVNAPPDGKNESGQWRGREWVPQW